MAINSQPVNHRIATEGQAAATPYSASQPLNATMDPQTVAQAGGNQPHYNMQPYLVLNYCIALQGIFPFAPLIP